MADGLEYEIGGRKVSHDQFFESLGTGIEAMVLEGVVAEIANQLRGVQCPVHGVSPAVTILQSGMNPQFILSDPCCENLKSGVDKLLGQLGDRE
jgi:hypothetical protein